MTKIEEVARAICVALGRDPDADFRGGDGFTLSVAVPDGEAQCWRQYERAARAAIKAMRTPTEAMLRAAVGNRPTGPAQSAYEDMIDAAITSPRT